MESDKIRLLFPPEEKPGAQTKNDILIQRATNSGVNEKVLWVIRPTISSAHNGYRTKNLSPDKEITRPRVVFGTLEI